MVRFSQPITVTRPSLPSLDAYIGGLRGIWDRGWLTNAGPLSQELEGLLAQRLGAPVSLQATGAAALTAALQALDLQGEVITTPFSFAATANALVQCGLTPVFADIETDRLTLDPAAVEAAIGPRTSAILAVHIFGNVCRHDELAAIAARHGLALVYDAAHAFGVGWRNQLIGQLGDMSMFSLHATKLFHTVEGGALTYRDPALGARLAALRNHGLEPDGDVRFAGMNAKMSELHALMGLLMLEQVEPAIAAGRAIEETYRARLAAIPGIRMLPPAPPEVRSNHSFVPVLIDEQAFGMPADAVKAALNRNNVGARRYFTPLLCDMTAFREAPRRDPLTRARAIGPAVLALPTYATLAIEDVHGICDILDAIRQDARRRR